MVLRFVPENVVGRTAYLWISVRDRLWALLTRIPENIVGAPHLVVRPFRQQVEEILATGIAEYLRFVEENERRYLSLAWRPTERSMAGRESVKAVGSSLYAETNSEVSMRLEKTILGLANLIWSMRSFLSKEGVCNRSLRQYLYGELKTIERCCRDLGGSDFIPFIPNARTNKSIPEAVLNGMAVNILSEMGKIRAYIHELRHDPRAVDILTGLKYSPLMNLHGIQYERNLCVSDVVDRLASAHPRLRRGLRALSFEEFDLRARMDTRGRLEIFNSGGSPQFRRALDVIAVNGRELILPWDLST
jgi:hypothetical protein